MKIQRIAITFASAILSSMLSCVSTPAAAPPLPTGLVAYWSFDDASYGVVEDLSASGNDGLVTGATIVPGKVGKALSFAGTGQERLSIPNDKTGLNRAFGQIAIAGWFYLVEPRSGEYGSTLISNTDGEGWALRVNGTDFYFDIRIPDAGGRYTAPTPFPIRTWVFVTVNYDGGLVKIYFDGKKIAQKTCTGIVSSSLASTFLGNEPAGTEPQGSEFSFTGMIDELMVFDRSLSEKEIDALFARR